MKDLYSCGKWTLCILSDNEYGVYDNTKGTIKKSRDGTEHNSYQYKCYSSLKYAMRELARLVANDECECIKTWIVAFDKISKRIEIACRGM